MLNMKEFTKSLYIFGDSIMKGVMFDKNNQKYVLAPTDSIDEIADSLHMRIINSSKFGCTIDKGYDRIMRTLSKDDHFDVALLEFGGNDCDFNWVQVSENPEGEFEPKTPLTAFRDYYTKIINELRRHSITPVIMTLPPIDAEKYLNRIVSVGNLNRDNILKWLGDVQMIYRYQELYSNTVSKIAQATGTILVDVRSYFLETRKYYTLMCDDGIHPNEEGHELIRHAIRDAAARIAPVDVLTVPAV